LFGGLRFLSSPFTALIAAITIAWSWGSVIIVSMACVLSISSSEDSSSRSSGGTGGRGKRPHVKLESRGETGGGSTSSSDSLIGTGSL